MNNISWFTSLWSFAGQDQLIKANFTQYAPSDSDYEQSYFLEVFGSNDVLR